MKKWTIFLLHLGHWLLYLTIVSTLLPIFSDASLRMWLVIDQAIFFSPLGISLIAPALISFYLSYFSFFKKYYVKRKIFRLLAAIVLSSLLVAGLDLLIAYFTMAPFSHYHMKWDSCLLVSAGTSFFYLCLIQGMLGLIMKGFVSGFSDMKEKAELNKKNYEMELALIKAQISPHFLFNTINNIDVLIQKDAAKASAYLNKLSDMMRFMLYEIKTEKIPMAKELSYIERYIELQKIRTSNASYIKYEVKGAADTMLIEPMLFIPFIENAFKHAENKKIENAIDIRIRIENDRIDFECRNSYSSEKQLRPEQGGLGNELIQRRLALLYPGKHAFKVENENHVYKVNLSLTTG